MCLIILNSCSNIWKIESSIINCEVRVNVRCRVARARAGALQLTRGVTGVKSLYFQPEMNVFLEKCLISISGSSLPERFVCAPVSWDTR